MDLSLSPEQEELRDVVHRALGTVARDDIINSLQQQAESGFLPGPWEQMSRAGWTGLSIGEEYDGAGAAMSDVGVVVEEYGRRGLPQIFFVATTLSPLLIAETGSDAQKARWLPALASGSERVTVALSESTHGWSPADIRTTLTDKDGGLLLEGRKLFVPDAAGATRVLVAARLGDSGAIGLVLVDLDAPGVSHQLIDGFVSWQSLVTFDGVRIDPDRVLGAADTDSWPGIERAVHQAIPLLGSYQVGSCQAVFDMSLQYTRSRIAFGQPIGKFQRVQDHAIELVNHLDAARWTTYEAIWKFETSEPGFLAAMHMAKSIVAEAHWEACNFAHEIHAGIGVDMQYDLAKHTYLSRSLYHFLGEPLWHRDQMTRELNW
jgi:alkylation response protein AidB-like acyl-CoA dehydrogenase